MIDVLLYIGPYEWMSCTAGLAKGICPERLGGVLLEAVPPYSLLDVRGV